MKEKSVRTRIAPSPTGFPHIGTVYQAMIDRAWATHNEGTFIVRIEDTDKNRVVEDAENKILEALDWIGLIEDEGVRKGGEYSPYRQSERLDIYKKYANKLIEDGNAYYCFCSAERLKKLREAQQKKNQPPMYDKHCRDIPLDEAEKRMEDGESCVVRMKVPEDKTIIVEDLLRGNIDFESSTVDDQVILKSDGYPTYHLAVVVDDHLMEISHVVRGAEWIPSFPKHKLLYDYFDWQMPVFVHTPLILNPGGGKLSKRHSHSNVDWYIKEGFLPEALLNFLALLGWSHPQSRSSDSEVEMFTFDEFCKHFDIKDLKTSNPKFDLTKLEWLNGQYIKELTLEEFYEKVVSFNPGFKDLDQVKFKKALSLVQERVKKLSEIEDLIWYFFNTPESYNEIKELSLKESKEDLETTKEQIKKVIEVLENLEGWNAENIDDALDNLKEKENIKPRQFFMPIRIIVTGRAFSPHIGDTLEVVGRDESVKRLTTFLNLD